MRQRKRWGIVAFLLLASAYLALFQLERHVAPVVQDAAEVRALQWAHESLQGALKDIVADEQLLGDLFLRHTNASGELVAVSLDSRAVLRLESRAYEGINAYLAGLGKKEIRVPAGVATGHELFASMGPLVPVHVIPVGAAEVSLLPTVEETGINNVHLTLYLVVRTHVRVVVPFSGKVVLFEDRIPVAQELIVGKDPCTTSTGGASFLSSPSSVRGGPQRLPTGKVRRQRVFPFFSS
ncbi:MAG: sporulation protein YunB [Brockia lithotrophica]|nr:sporulation protein YunB [Brockia lithotrophica]